MSKDPLVLGDRFSMYSGPMVRVLAGVWRELTEPSKLREKGASVPDAIGRDEVVEYFQKLDVLMELKQPLGRKGCPPAFAVGGTAPISRAGTIRQLERTLVEWGLPDDCAGASCCRQARARRSPSVSRAAGSDAVSRETPTA